MFIFVNAVFSGFRTVIFTEEKQRCFADNDFNGDTVE